MNRYVLAFLVLVLLPAGLFADTFTNGGFETGDFSGWTQKSGEWYGGWPISPGAYTTNGNWQGAIVTPGPDPLAGAALNRVYAGNYAARINNPVNDYSVNVIKQFVSNYADTHIYFEWAAVLQASHGSTDSDNFTLLVTDETDHVTLATRQYNSYDNGSIFTLLPSNWFYTPWQVEDIAVTPGHDFTISLLAADCPYGGHAGYVYLDGFAPIVVQPGDVPEPSSVVLLASVAGGLALLAKRRKRLV